jgi:hypothetical protein
MHAVLGCIELVPGSADENKPWFGALRSQGLLLLNDGLEIVAACSEQWELEQLELCPLDT